MWNFSGKSADLWLFRQLNGVVYRLYLSNRKQVVNFEGQMSSTAPVTVGVAPRLHTDTIVLYHIHERHTLNTLSDNPIDMYADDSTITATAQQLNLWRPPSTKTWMTLQCGATATSWSWMQKRTWWWWRRRLGGRNTWNRTNLTCSLETRNSKVLSVTDCWDYSWTTSYLWSAHIKKIQRTIFGYLALLWWIKDCRPLQTRLTFYNCYTLPHLNYCSTTWGSAAAGETIKLHRLQKGAAKTITDSGHLASSTPLMQQLLSLPQRIQCRQAQVVHKAAQVSAMDWFQNTPPSSSSVNGVEQEHPVQLSADLYVHESHKNVSRSTIVHTFAKIWNNLGTHIR